MSNQETIDDAKEIIQMYEDDEYDNFKDVIMDCRDMLDELSPENDKEVYDKMMAVLKSATQEFQELVDEDPSMAEYAEGLIDPALLEK